MALLKGIFSMGRNSKMHNLLFTFMHMHIATCVLGWAREVFYLLYISFTSLLLRQVQVVLKCESNDSFVGV